MDAAPWLNQDSWAENRFSSLKIAAGKLPSLLMRLNHARLRVFKCCLQLRNMFQTYSP